MNPLNTGDSLSPPALYFNLQDSVQILDLCQVKFLNLTAPQAIIVGGGGLLYFKKSMDYLCNNKKRPLIGWGFGCNDHNSKNISFPPLKEFDLLGVRDYTNQFQWTPCASCMRPEFDHPQEQQRDIVIYEHQDRPIPIKGFEKINNTTPFETVMKFLSSAEIVLTNTYHGAYWSILLAKKVVAFPFSNRFHGFKHTIPLCEPQDWERAILDSQAYPEALKECRQANQEFYGSVMSLINIKLQ